MLIRYSNHAALRRGERIISIKEIKEAISSGVKSNAEGGARKATHKTKDKILIVIYVIIKPQEIKIVTAYYQ